MIKIIDLDIYPLSIKNGAYGGAAGSKDGISINNENWLIKYPKSLSKMEGLNASYSTAPLSEFLGSHIYKILGFDVHETILGERNNKIVVGCKDFEIDGKKLLEIRTLKNHTNDIIDKLIDEGRISSEESHTVDIDEILIHIENNDLLKDIYGIKQRFFEQIIIDIFINNNDRNNGNWGILRKEGFADSLAPVFDNGGSFNTKISEEKIRGLLSSSELVNNATNVFTVYSKKGYQLNAKKLIKEIENIPEFQDAVKKYIPIIKKRINDIFDLMDQIPSVYTLKNGIDVYVFSEERKKLYKKQLEICLEKLLLPLYEKY